MKGAGGVYKRGRLWWLQYTIGGVRRFESSGSMLRADAVALLQKRMVDARERPHPNSPASFEDLRTLVLNDYSLNERKSASRAKSALAHLGATFAGMRATRIDGAAILEYANARQAKPATVRYELAILKRGFALALKVGKVAAVPPFPSVRVSNTRAGFFEDHQFRAVLANLPADLQPLALFYYWTGWRKNEALGLKWRNVALEAGEIRLDVGTTKSGAGRVLPFSAIPELAKVIRAQRERTQALEREAGAIIPWVFHRSGRPIRDFRGAWRSACLKAGVPGKLAHDFRRTAARNMIRQGMAEKHAMAVTGHATRAVFDRYHIVATADVAEALKRAAGKR